MADQQAQVTLTALNPTYISPDPRKLQLDSEHRIVRVGRTSKSIKKGYVASANNAWFDSPVMSRNHAEILLHSDNKTIQLQDIGSMHGTMLNGEALVREEPRSLNNGDEIKFGAEVRRGSETFPACSFKVEYEFSSAQPVTTGTIKVPESSDLDDEIEDTDDENMSDSDDMPIFVPSDNTTRSMSVEVLGTSSGPKGVTEDRAVDGMMSMKKNFPSAGNAENPFIVDSDGDQDTDEEMNDEVSDDAGDSDDADVIFLRTYTQRNHGSTICDPSESGSEADVEKINEVALKEVALQEVRRLSDNTGIEVSDVRDVRESSSHELWGESSEDEDENGPSDSDDDMPNPGHLLVSADNESENESDDESDDDVFAPESEDDMDMLPLPVPIILNCAGRSLTSALESECVEDSDDCRSSVGNDSTESVMGDDAGNSYQDSPKSIIVVDSSDEDSEMENNTTSDEVSKYEIMEKALASDMGEKHEVNGLPKSQALPWIAPWQKEISTEHTVEKSEKVVQPTQKVVAAFGPGTILGKREGASQLTAAGETKEKASVARRDSWQSDVFNVERISPASGKTAYGGSKEKAPIGREPSPSDAAMVKEGNTPLASIGRMPSEPKPMSATTVPGFSVVKSLIPEQHDFAKSMGEKTGKVDFFKAREENRARLVAKAASNAADHATMKSSQPSILGNMLPYNKFWTPGTTSSSPFAPHSTYHNHTVIPPVGLDHGDRVPPSVPFQHMWSPAPASSASLQAPRAAHAELVAEADLAAAHRAPTEHSLEVSYANNQMRDRLHRIEALRMRSEMRTQARVTPGANSGTLLCSSNPMTTSLRTSPPMPFKSYTLFSEASQSKKRKADSISESNKSQPSATEDKVKESTDREVDQVSHNAAGEIVGSAPAPSSNPEEPITRAPKRMKRFVEAVGYAALGGAAVGAGLFSVLVATAPDFL